jgi:hypothetical protein
VLRSLAQCVSAQVRMRSPGAARDTVAAMLFSLRLHRRLSPRQLTPDSYLTDGRALFRVVSQFVNGRSVMVWLEDCRTLETRARAACELEAMGMRAVGKAYARAAAPQSSTRMLTGHPAAQH